MHEQTSTNNDTLIVREEERDPSALPTFVYGFIGIIVLVAIVFATEAMYYSAQNTDDVAKLEKRDNPDHPQIKTTQLGKLGGYAWVDKDRNVVSIPIAKAIESTVRDVKAGKPLPNIPTATTPTDANPSAPQK